MHVHKLPNQYFLTQLFVGLNQGTFLLNRAMEVFQLTQQQLWNIVFGKGFIFGTRGVGGGSAPKIAPPSLQIYYIFIIKWRSIATGDDDYLLCVCVYVMVRVSKREMNRYKRKSVSHRETHPTWFKRLIIQEGQAKSTTSESLQATQGPGDMDTPFRGEKQLLMHALLPYRPASVADKSPTPSSPAPLWTQIL